jgi:hypothetical protein
MGVHREEVSSGADAPLLVEPQNRIEKRQIVLGLVDRVLGQARRRPPHSRVSDLLGSRGELIEARQTPFGSPNRLEGVERGHAGPALLEIDTWIRKDEAPRRSSDREPQGESLPQKTIVVDWECAPKSDP